MMALIYVYPPAWKGAAATLVFVVRELRGSQVASTRIGVTGYNRIHHIVAYVRQITAQMGSTSLGISKLYHLGLLISFSISIFVRPRYSRLNELFV